MAARINELRQKRIEASAALQALIATHMSAATAAGRGFDDTEKAAQADGEKKLADLDGLIKAEERRIELEKSSARSDGTGRIEAVHDNRQDRPWSSFGEQLLAVAQASSPGGQADPRLFAAASGASTGVAADGGFLVQRDYSTKLLERAVEAAQLIPLCDSFEASANSDSMEAPYIDETSRATGSRWGGVRVYRRGEADTVTSSKPKLAKFSLELEDLMAICYATGRSVQDAGLLEQIISKSFISEFAFKADDEVLNGNGVGMMSGIFVAAANPALVTQAIETGQTLANSNGGLLPANISKMWMHMPARLKGGAVWLYNGELSPALDALALPVGTAALEPRFVNYGPDGVLRIKGRPAIEVEQCAAPGTVGDIALVNLSEYALLTKGGLKTDASMHVRFIYDEMTYRFMTRINGKPKWRSAVAPYKGAADRSPYVVLNTRS